MPDPILLASLVGGLLLLALGGDLLVRGAVRAARALGASPLIAGIFIVGFGTSLPEIIVSVNAAFTGSPGLAIGNIVGSSIANVFLVLAIPALIFYNKFASDISAFSDRMSNFAAEVSVRLSRRLHERRDA